jgi:hypothetical protein
MEFIVLTLVSILVVIAIVRYSLRFRKYNPVDSLFNIMLLVVLEIICMLLGKYGANWGLPWWIYYTIPMLLTIFVPTLYFKMNKKEAITYLVLTFISAPLIHVIFSLFGWNNFMPFIKVSSLLG